MYFRDKFVVIRSLLETQIEYLKGVGPARADILKKELGIYTYWDLLNYFPFRYVDRSKLYKVAELRGTSISVPLRGVITNLREMGAHRAKRLVATFTDDSGSMELVWFKGIKYIKSGLKVGHEYLVYGKPAAYGGKLNIAHPELELIEVADDGPKGFQAVYSSTEKATAKGLHSKGIWKLQQTLVNQLKGEIKEVLTPEIMDALKLLSREEAYINIHYPYDIPSLQKAQFRLKFEELFFLQLKLLLQKGNRLAQLKGFSFNEIGDFFNEFYKKKLPFELTNAQKRVLKEIRHDMGGGKHMNRLLQGDVGSGKTVVALMCMLMALDNGFQACLMAPTEILANQHFESLRMITEGLGIEIALLTGSSKAAERKLVHQGLEDGSIHILIGTHALLEDKVKYKNLGLVVIDEQHRFGVAQRAKLWKKNNHPPHVLVMTATPIPRTLAMTFYGDLDVSVIDELPPGRKAIKTIHRFDSSRLKVFGFIEDEIKKGRQIYIVYPLIKESEKLDYKDLMDGYESITRRFPLPKYKVSIVHGQMKSTDKDFEMQRFLKGETQIMVATTVIEVGVNVPNASVMVIESAERFGLSQLHQLRGRVGRGAEQSYCILMTGNKLSEDGKLRMETMVRTNDGFEISEVDLKLRGPGDIEGTQQSGLLNLKISDLAKDGQILQLARNTALNILSADEHLQSEKNKTLLKHLQELNKGRVNWSKIS